MVLEELSFNWKYNFYSVKCINNRKCTVWFLTNAYIWVIHIRHICVSKCKYFLLPFHIQFLSPPLFWFLSSWKKFAFSKTLYTCSRTVGTILSLASFTRYEHLGIQPCWYVYLYFIPFGFLIVFHYMNLLQLFTKSPVGFLFHVGE